LLMVAVAPLAGLSGRDSFRMMLRDGGNHSSPNSGIPEAATAGALGVRLGGASSYFGTIVDKPTIGDKVRELNLESYCGAIRLMYGSAALLLVLCAMMVLIF